jgi:hypothetical protein
LNAMFLVHFIMPEGVDGKDWKAHMLSLASVDARAVQQAAQQQFCTSIKQYSTAPRRADCPNRQRCKYAQWMLFGGLDTNHVELPKVAYLTGNIPLFKKHAAARARLGGAPIRALMEHQPTSTYHDRICQRCKQGVDDEVHRVATYQTEAHCHSEESPVC